MFWIFVITKVLIVSVVALVAELAFRSRRAPQINYAMWFAILIILVLPPVVSLPVLRQAKVVEPAPLHESPIEIGEPKIQQAAGGPVGVSASEPQDSLLTTPSVPALAIKRRDSPPPTRVRHDLDSRSLANRNPERLADVRSEFASTIGPKPVTTAATPIVSAWSVAIVWIVGGLFILVRRVLLLKALGRLLQRAVKAPAALEKRFASVARETNQQTRPELLVANGVFSPFLWKPMFGKSRIVIPEKLVDLLSGESMDAVLRHELVHFNRWHALRRTLEVLITSVWWWLPISWLARRRLQELEELCTDAEVIRDAPTLNRAYARALLDTEEFLASRDRCDLHAVPTFTDHHLLKTRIDMIVRNHNKPTNRFATQFLTLAVGCLLLPMGILTAGTYSQDGASTQDGASRVEVAQAVSRTTPPTQDSAKSGGGTRVSVNTTSDGNVGISVNTSGSDTISVSVSGNGKLKKAKLKRQSDTSDPPVVWELIDYENSEMDLGEDDLGWLFMSMETNEMIVNDDREFHHPDLEVLSDLVDRAEGNDIDDVLEDMKDLISVDARSQVATIVAGRRDLDEHHQEQILDILQRKDTKPRYGFRNTWKFTAKTIDVLRQRDDLTNETSEAIERMRRQDPEYLIELQKKVQERGRQMEVHQQRMVERSQELQEQQQRFAEAQRQLAQQQAALQVRQQLHRAHASKERQERLAEDLERQAEQLLRQAERLREQAKALKNRAKKNQQ